MIPFPSAAPVLAAFFCMALPAPSATNLARNGTFDAGLADWGATGRKGVSITSTDGNAWLALDGPASVNQRVRLEPDWLVLRVAARMRATGVVLGDDSWKDARFAMDFKDADGKHLSPWPNVFHARGTTDWMTLVRHFKIPRGAAFLDLNPAMFGVAGKVEFDDITVEVAHAKGQPIPDLPLPPGAPDTGDLAAAWRQTSPTRETICLNGLWRFLPSQQEAGPEPPAAGSGWGWFKVPGVWPSSPGSAQQVWAPENFGDEIRHGFDQAWYRRSLAIPETWAGRRVCLDFRMIQTRATVWIDGAQIGEIYFPGGRLDITSRVRPGARHDLAVLLTARPLDPESNVFMAPERIITSKATVDLKGVTGDVMLVSEPPADAITDVQIRTSVREGTITIEAGIANPGAGDRILAAEIREAGKPVKAFEGAPFDPAALANGRTTFAAPWPDARRWDTDSPHLYEAVVTLKTTGGDTLDQSLPARFGFREFSIRGRDFLLNGTRIHLRALHTRNINGDADIASIEGCRNTCRRLARHGFNFLITANYNFSPGEVSHMDALFDACDESGTLAAFSLPHAKDFNWKLDTPEQSARYRYLCEWLVRRAQNHPSIILYSMNHNATGYYGDQNPARMDGIYEPSFPPRPSSDPKKPASPDSRTKNRAQAQIAADIARSLDPSRPVYHHQSGNLGDLYTVNIYLNWAPPQERSDWLEHWSTAGKKPMFFVEWGLPHVSSWSSYRGPQFIWRNPALQQIWDSEFAAAHVGERAYQMTETKLASARLEQDLWAKGQPFHWSRLIQHFRSQDENYTEIQALFASDNWRSHRTRGISAMLPWDQENLWRKTREFPTAPTPAPGRWQNLQSPGIVPDQIPPPSQFIYCRDDRAMRPSALGETFLRWNTPLCAFLGGEPKQFTEKSHVFRPGETARKQIVLLNDTRRPATARYEWHFPPGDLRGKGEVTLPPGDAASVPLTLPLPKDIAPGQSFLEARIDFGDGTPQSDRLPIDVIAPAPALDLQSKVLLWDPRGLATPMLRQLGVKAAPLPEGAAPPKDAILVIGRQALALGAPGPDLSAVADGLRVLVFEQDAEVLERRLGFRVNIHGLRRAFTRTPAHPALEGIGPDLLRDWRGAATLVPPHLDIGGVELSDPKWTWCGFENTRVWRCGNRGSVATVLIEKPDRGDWLPLVDGGFDLQYAPLLECVHGKGRIVFCQLDVTARTHDEPVAQNLCANLLRHLDAAKPPPSRPLVFSGNPEGLDLLIKLGLDPSRLDGNAPSPDALLVLGPGHRARALDAAIASGTRVLCLGLSAAELAAAFDESAPAQDGPATSAPLRASDPLLAGISSAELHWRCQPSIASLSDPGDTANPALVTIARGKGRIVLCQAAPWMFDHAKKPYLRTTHRRTTFLVARLLANLGARATCPILDRFAKKPDTDKPWLEALYLQEPIAEDDPYRYYRW